MFSRTRRPAVQTDQEVAHAGHADLRDLARRHEWCHITLGVLGLVVTTPVSVGPHVVKVLFSRQTDGEFHQFEQFDVAVPMIVARRVDAGGISQQAQIERVTQLITIQLATRLGTVVTGGTIRQYGVLRLSISAQSHSPPSKVGGV